MKVLSDQWVDLVLTDINMPNMTGLELVKAMKEDDLLRSIPVVMVTTEGSEERVQESLRLGASGYIKKPFQPEDLKEILCSILGEKEDGDGNPDEEYEGGDF
jgi:two-component system chemotaxis response regulator CheY